MLSEHQQAEESFRPSLEPTEGRGRPLSLFDFLFLVFDKSAWQDDLDLFIQRNRGEESTAVQTERLHCK